MSFFEQSRVRAAGLYLAVWLLCVAFLAATGGNFLFPVSTLLFFGLLTGLAVFLTRKANAPPVPVQHPKTESLVLLAYLVVYALVLFGPVSGWVKNAFSPGPAQEVVVLTYKLVVHLIIPALLIRLAHGHLRGIFDAGLERRGIVPTLVLFSAIMIALVGLMNSLFEKLVAGGVSGWAVAAWVFAAWLWMAMEVGVTEEFLFHGLLQSRLTAWVSSAPLAIVLTAIIFGLVHVPSLWLRGGEEVAQQAPGLPQVIAMAIAGLGPITLMLGVLWHRTRSFLLVVLVHAAIDTMPHVEEMIKVWG